MINSKCVTCGNTIILNEQGEHNPRGTKYWSYEKDGSKRPYCDAMCSLLDYQNKKQEQK